MIQSFNHIPNMVSFDKDTDSKAIENILPFTVDMIQKNNRHHINIINYLRHNCKGKWGKQYRKVDSGQFDNLPITLFFELREDALRAKLAV